MIQLSTALRLTDLFWPRFEERDGIVVRVGVPTPADLLAGSATRTAAEAFHSHIHVLDEFRHDIPWGPDPTQPEQSEAQAPDWSHPEYALACDLARTIAQMWLRKLETDFPRDRFRVYATMRNDPIVRFHRVYAGEAPWYADADAAEQVARGEVAVYASVIRDRD